MGVKALDRFKRANSTTTLGTADSGQAWTSGNGTWGIDTERAYTPAGVTSGTDGALAFIDVGETAQSIFLDIVGVAQTAVQDVGILARYVDANNWWAAFLNRSSGGQVSVYAGKFIASVGTYVIANNVAATPAALNSSPPQFPVCIGLTVDASNNWKCYFNGVQVGSTATDSALSTATKCGIKNYNTTTNEEIDGFWVSTPSGVYVPPETVSSLGSFSRIVKGLSPDAYWPMDEAAGSITARDVSGNAMDLYRAGTPTFGSSDVLRGGSGGSVSGWLNANRLIRGCRPELDAGTGDFTLMLWGAFDPTQVAAKNFNMPVFHFDSMPSGGLQGDGLLVYLRTDANDVRVLVNSVGANFAGLGSGADNTPHCWIIERVSGTVTVYLDGAVAGTSSALTGAIMPAGRYAGMGGDPSGNGTVNYYVQGRQNHTAFWKRALTAAERSLLVSAGHQLGVVT